MSRKEGWKLNKQRRKQISEVVSRVESVQAELESLPDDIQGIMDEETEYRGHHSRSGVDWNPDFRILSTYIGLSPLS